MDYYPRYTAPRVDKGEDLSMSVVSPNGTGRAVKKAERLAQDIVREISEAGLAPGVRLESEAIMAEKRGVSRTTLREALRILELHGVITLRTGPGGGPELADIGHDAFSRIATLHFHLAGVTFRQLLEARRVLEPRMAGLAAVNRTPDQIAALRHNLEVHARAQTAQRLVSYAHQFHFLIGDMAGDDNKALSLLTGSLHGIFDPYQRQVRTVELMRMTIQLHEGIADAIERRHSTKAARLMEEHMNQSAETFAQEHPSLIDNTVSWLSW